MLLHELLLYEPADTVTRLPDVTSMLLLVPQVSVVFEPPVLTVNEDHVPPGGQTPDTGMLKFIVQGVQAIPLHFGVMVTL